MKAFLKKHLWIFTLTLSVCFIAVTTIGLYHVHNSPITQDNSPHSPSQSVEYVAVISSVLADMTQEELVEESSLVITAKLVDKSSAFQIKSVGGGVSNFTDYYFEPKTVLRGEVDGSPISVRVNEGVSGNLEVVNEISYDFEIGNEYMLFLYQPSYGGGFTTEGDYYYVTGSQLGVYKLNSTQTRSNDKVYQSVIYSNESNIPNTASPISLSSFSAKVSQINETTPPQDDLDYQLFLKAQQENLESGFISQEEYEQFIAESQQYATILPEE